MPGRAHIRCAVALAAISVTAVAVAAVTTLPAAAVSQARPITLTKPSPPAVQPLRGRPFTPVQGDWEGTANGFAASFNLVLDATRRQRAGVPRYGIQDLVMLRPIACPPDPARYRETLMGGRLPSTLGRHGALGLDRFGVRGSLTGSHSATLGGSYELPGCRGTVTWHMHPAMRRTVADGTWTVHWPGGERASFHVQAGGRLATGIRLPHSVATCAGISGTLDVFIGVRGGSGTSQAGVALKLRFANEHAAGTLAARGCPGVARVTAARTGG